MTRSSVLILALVGSGLVSACSQGQQPATQQQATPAAAPAPAPIPPGPKLFVTNEAGGDLTVIDVGTERVVATIPLGKRPRGVRVSPDGSLVYVALSGSPIGGPGVDESKLPPPDKGADGVGVVSTKDMKLLRILRAGSDPEQIALSLDGETLFVTNEDVGEATAIATSDGHVLNTAKVGAEPEGVNLRPDGKVIYVTSEGDNVVSVIDVASFKVVKKLDVGARPRSTAFLPDSSRAYVPSENGSSMTVIDAQKHRILKTITLKGELVRPMGTVVSPDGGVLFTTTGRGKQVVFIDTKTNEQTGALEVGQRPWGIAVSPDGKMLFTANGPGNDVSFVDVAGRSVKAKVKVGERPWGIAYVP
jgi:YVTN family beta-propeller protein